MPKLHVMARDAFGNFIFAFGAARELLGRAHKHGFLIESIVLYAALLDGLLRIGLILKRQIKNADDAIEDTLIEQTKGGKYYSERQIYRMALQEKVTDQEMYEALGRLYDRRNEIVHKFFLTPITYDSLAGDLVQYEHLYEKLLEIVRALECEQVQRGIGMTRSRGSSRAEREEIFRKVDSKIAPLVPREDHE